MSRDLGEAHVLLNPTKPDYIVDIEPMGTKTRKHVIANRILGTIALILAIIIQAAFIISAIALYQRLQAVGEVLQGPSVEEQVEDGSLDMDLPVDPYEVPQGGPTEFWTEEGADGTPLYCYAEPEFGETICEVIE